MSNTLLSQFKVPGYPTPIPDPFFKQSLNLSDLINFGINLLFAIAILTALAFLVWGGISWITSGGNKEGLEKARKTIIYAIVGLVVVLLSVVIMNFIGAFLGIKIFSNSDTDNSKSTPNTREYDCPDGSNNYHCGQTWDTKCPLCSADPNCAVAPWPILECTDSSAFCIEDIDCPVEPRNCAPGTKAVASCTRMQNAETGHCVTNCINYSFP